MTTSLSTNPVTLNETFSFYVSCSDVAAIQACADIADAVTVKGPGGPEQIRRMRARGWSAPVLFDRSGYDPKVEDVDPERWFDEQSLAGADRLITAGSWVPWDETGEQLKRAVEIEAGRIERRPGATALLAVEHRWLSRCPRLLSETLKDLEHPVALVLSHPTDPLGVSNAVQGLISVASTIEDVSVLRTDHGGLGAIAYGARHAAIGLRGAHRHFVPVGRSGGGKNQDWSARVFFRRLMDWFTAGTIAGWAISTVELRCDLECCRGASVDRFFDPRHEANALAHNRMTLSRLADQILDAPKEERRQIFSKICAEAVDRHGPMGKISMVTKPKDQLLQWAFA